MDCSTHAEPFLRRDVELAVDAVLRDAVAAVDVEGPVVVGVSGGADSCALLAWSVRAGLDPIAVYVDHGLRPASASDGARVAALAAAFGVGCRIERVNVAAGGNLEERARDARYACLERVRRATGANAVLVGHTADDQAETTLLALLRGSGSAGLGGMSPRRGTVVRPLLACRRAQTQELCARLGIAPLHDPMNVDSAFRRVWVRRELLPLLERGAGRDLVPVLVRQAALLREESALLDALGEGAWPGGGEPDRSAARLAALPVPVARRAVRRWLGPPVPSAAEIEAVLTVARAERRAAQLTRGRRVTRRGGRLVVERSIGEADPASVVECPLPGRAAGLGLELDAWIEHDTPVRWPDGRWTCVVDADAVGEAARLRRRPSNGRVLLTRPTGEPIWTVGYRIDGGVRVSASTRRFLWIAAVPQGGVVGAHE
ncbi:MAG: tRNA lysidine(34) synthetase TilS [Acidimicrobiia bacterium]